jgi:toxin ParE1/3/4
LALRITFRPAAEEDLNRLYVHIRDEGGGPGTALGYILRIRRFCEGLSTFPHRGRERPDLRHGVRIIGFERRVAITYRVTPDAVEIARIFYGGRELIGSILDDRLP